MFSNRILIGSHHKCGTVWIDQIFYRFTNVLGIPYTHADGQLNRDARCVFSAHSTFADYLDDEYVGLHIVRDPRDVCVSGARYHVTDYAIDNEEWLSTIMVDGLPYFSYLRNIDFIDRLSAEIEHVTLATIDSMIATSKIDGFLTVKYEDLISEFSVVATCQDISTHLELDALEAMVLLGSVVSTHRYLGSPHLPEHFTSSGRSREWENISPEITQLLNDKLGDAARIMGYV